jgi:hypothetical protein
VDHGFRAFEVAKPVLLVCRSQFGRVLFDKGLEDAIDVSANRLSIGFAIVLSRR